MRRLAGMMLALSAPAFAQYPGDPPPPVDIPRLRAEGVNPETFLPVDWRIEAIERGLIDRDGRLDVVMVIKDTKPINLVEIDGIDARYDSNPRMLVVLLGTKNGFRLGQQNSTLIPRLANQNEDDLFDALSMKAGTIRVAMHEHFDAGGWKLGSTKYALRWQGGHLIAIGFDFDGMTRDGATRKTSANFLTGKIIETTGSMDGEKPDATRTIRIPAKPLSLEDIGDGLMFDPVPR